MLFLNAIPETSTQAEGLGNADSDFRLMAPYFPRMREVIQWEYEYDADLITIVGSRTTFRDFDRLWKRYTKECRLDETGKARGMMMKEENTIVPKWPLRLKKNATQAEFSRLHASGRTGWERYVEWKRAV